MNKEPTRKQTGHQPGMKDLRDYMEESYLPHLMLAARKIVFPMNPGMADQNECLVFLHFKLGRRPHELVQSKVMDIDFNEREINWNIAKKRKAHQERLPIDKDTAEYLKDYIQKLGLKPHHYLFSWAKYGVKDAKYYTHLDRRRAWQIISEASEKANIKAINGKTVTPRILRHSFAVFLRKRGVDIATIQDLLAHSEITTTAIYTKFGRKELRAKVDEAFK